MSKESSKESFGEAAFEQEGSIFPYEEAEFYHSVEETYSTSTESIYPKWRRAPRTPSDFPSSKRSISSCRDSDYEAWLENYYQELYLENSEQTFEDKQTDTSDLVQQKIENIVTSFFPEIQKDIWSFSTKYWGPKHVRRHWPLKKREEYLFVPSIHPNLNLRSRYGRFHSLLNSAAAVPECDHKRLVSSIYKIVLEGLENTKPQLLKILHCDNLCNLKWLDFMTKKTVMKCLCKFFRTQSHIQKVYFENADLGRMEGIILLCALSRNGGDTLKELHMWKMFAFGQCPLLLNDLSQKGRNTTEKRFDRFFTKIHFLQILNNFSSLTHLSINYAYLANQNGDALLCLKCIRTGSLLELRILCLKDERPFLTNPGYGVGGWSITDGVWRRAAEWCPDMRVKFVFLNMPQYENVIVFLSKSIPVSYVYLSSGMDFTFENPWDIDSTLLELRNWYSSTLETLCLHLWHHRDLLDFVIKRKILEEFPNLLTFEFIGILEDVETAEEFFCELSKGIYKLKTLLFWVEERHTNRKKLEVTRRRIVEIREKYNRKFQTIPIDADLRTYAL